MSFLRASEGFPCHQYFHFLDENNAKYKSESQSYVCIGTNLVMREYKWLRLWQFFKNNCQKQKIILDKYEQMEYEQFGANNRERHLSLKFINDLNLLDSTALNFLFLIITDFPFLKHFYLIFQTLSMRCTIHFNVRDGNQHLSIIDKSNILNPDFLKLIEKIIIHPTERRGDLTHFTLISILNEQTLISMSNILQFSRDTLEYVCISFQGKNSFNRNSSLSLIENSLVSMTQLKQISLKVDLIEKKENTQPNEMQNNTKTIQPSFETELNDTTPKSWFSKGTWLNGVSTFSFEGSLSLTSAIDMETALGNSHHLKSLTVKSDITMIRIIAAYCLDFSKPLKQLFLGLNQKKERGENITVKVNNTLEVLHLCSKELSLGSFLEFCSIIENMRNLKELQIIIDELIMNSHEDNSKGNLKELFINISKIQSLQSIDIYISIESSLMSEIGINPQDIYLPLKNLPLLRIIAISFSWAEQVQVNPELFYKELVLGLICYTGAEIITTFKHQIQDIFKQITDGYQLKLKILTLTTLQFYKMLAPFLDFHPHRHLEDLYF